MRNCRDSGIGGLNYLPTLLRNAPYEFDVRQSFGPYRIVADALELVPSARVGHIGMYRDEETLIPHPYYSDVEPQLQWIPQREWVYTLDFDAEEYILNEDVIELVFEGLDTYADVWLNDKHLFYADNMFKKWTCDVEDILKEKNNNTAASKPLRSASSAYSRKPATNV